MRAENSHIKEINSKTEYIELVRVLREAFGTVAAEYDLTDAIAPTNPAFSTLKKLSKYIVKPVCVFGLYSENRMIGCIAIEQSKKNNKVYYIEKLAVVPEERHQGFGAVLLSYAIERIKENGGTIASVAIMNNNKILKKWYQNKGFIEIRRKVFANLPFEVCYMSIDVNIKNKYP